MIIMHAGIFQGINVLLSSEVNFWPDIMLR